MEESASRSLQEDNLGYLLIQSGRRETATAVLEDIRFKSELNMFDTLSGGKVNTNAREGLFPRVCYVVAPLPSRTCLSRKPAWTHYYNSRTPSQHPP